MKQMEVQIVFEYSYTRKNKVKTVASARSIKIIKYQVIDPALLFQRLLVPSQSGDLCLDEVMKYTLSIFEGNISYVNQTKPNFWRLYEVMLSQ